MQDIAFKHVFSQCPTGILVTDLSLKIVRANRAAHRILRARNLIGMSFSSLFDDVANSHMRTFCEYLDSGREMSLSCKFCNSNVDNWCELSGTKTEDECIGKLIIWSVSDISVHKKRETELEQLAHYDGLTGAYTRYYFYHLANRHFQQFIVSKEPFCVLMLDLDDFKLINDIYGHSKGDHILQNFSALVAKNLRKNDLFGRVGGEEFAIVLPKTTPSISHDIATRICHEVARYFVDPNVTVSIGITAINNVEDSIEQAIIRADEALYTVKSNGKNNALLNCF